MGKDGLTVFQRATLQAQNAGLLDSFSKKVSAYCGSENGVFIKHENLFMLARPVYAEKHDGRWYMYGDFSMTREDANAWYVDELICDNYIDAVKALPYKLTYIGGKRIYKERESMLRFHLLDRASTLRSG